MTPAEADQRIILSRRTLAKYAHMAKAGDGPGPESLPLFSEEISILLHIAEEHRGKAAKIETVVAGWMEMQEAVKAKLN